MRRGGRYGARRHRHRNGGNGAWDNYQCKHYGDSLKPSDIWVELGKLAYYTKRGDYSYPRRYYFIAPRGAGTKLSNLLKKPGELRSELLKQWDAHCRDRITKTELVECDAAMRDHIERLDFTIFQATPVLRIIEAHAKTRWYAARFGGGLPQRPEPLSPPNLPGDNEAVFVGELRRAYADHLKHELKDVDAGLALREDLREHFKGMRASSSTVPKVCVRSRATRCRRASSRSSKMRCIPASRTTYEANTPMVIGASSRLCRRRVPYR